MLVGSPRANLSDECWPGKTSRRLVTRTQPVHLEHTRNILKAKLLDYHYYYTTTTTTTTTTIYYYWIVFSSTPQHKYMCWTEGLEEVAFAVGFSLCLTGFELLCSLLQPSSSPQVALFGCVWSSDVVGLGRFEGLRWVLPAFWLVLPDFTNFFVGFSDLVEDHARTSIGL